MDIFREVQARREVWEAQQRVSMQQVREQWLGKVVSFQNSSIGKMYPWIPVDGDALIYAQVTEIDERGHVTIVYAYSADGLPFSLSFPLARLQDGFQLVEE